MQQNQDNLTDENPYLPPKSEDFRQPEINRERTIGQKIRHIALAALVFSLLATLVNFILGAINLFYYGKEKNIIILSLISIGLFFTYYITGVLFSIIYERHISKVKNKYIYSLVIVFILFFIFQIIGVYGYIFFKYDYLFSLKQIFYGLIKNHTKIKIIIQDIETLIIMMISIFFTIKMLDKHR